MSYSCAPPLGPGSVTLRCTATVNRKAQNVPNLEPADFDRGPGDDVAGARNEDAHVRLASEEKPRFRVASLPIVGRRIVAVPRTRHEYRRRPDDARAGNVRERASRGFPQTFRDTRRPSRGACSQPVGTERTDRGAPDSVSPRGRQRHGRIEGVNRFGDGSVLRKGLHETRNAPRQSSQIVRPYERDFQVLIDVAIGNGVAPCRKRNLSVLRPVTRTLRSKIIVVYRERLWRILCEEQRLVPCEYVVDATVLDFEGNRPVGGRRRRVGFEPRGSTPR